MREKIIKDLRLTLDEATKRVYEQIPEIERKAKRSASAVQYYNDYGIMFCIKAIFLLVYRSVLFYLLLNFIYITKQMITSFYDYMVSEIDKIHLS